MNYLLVSSKQLRMMLNKDKILIEEHKMIKIPVRFEMKVSRGEGTSSSICGNQV